MRKFIGAFIVASLFAAFLFLSHQEAKPSNSILSIHRPLWIPNRIANYITNDGQLVSHIPTRSAGMEWPAGSSKFINFASGIGLAGMKNSQIVTAVAHYETEFQPGNIRRDTSSQIGYTPADPNDPRFKVYIINQKDLANPFGNPDYINWPVADGAPIDANGKPLLLGTSTVWAVFNDFNDSLHNKLFMTSPMNVEVQMTAWAWAFNQQNALGDMIFFKFKIMNKSGKNISDTYATFFADIDIGDGIQKTGCDTTLFLAFQYKTNADPFYGDNPPAIGYKLLQGPIAFSPGDTAKAFGRRVSNFKNQPMTAFHKRINSGDPRFQFPQNGVELFRYMKGLNKFGDPVIDPTTGQATKFWHPGDPLTGAGWVDQFHSNTDFWMTSGPFALAANDSQEVAVGIIIAPGATGLESVRMLKQNAVLAQTVYNSLQPITTVQENPVNKPMAYILEQNYPNPFNPTTTIRFSLPIAGSVTLKVYNILGKEVATLIAEKLTARSYEVQWDAAGLSSGLYFYRLQTNGFVQTRKLILAK